MFNVQMTFVIYIYFKVKLAVYYLFFIFFAFDPKTWAAFGYFAIYIIWIIFTFDPHEEFKVDLAVYDIFDIWSQTGAVEEVWLV